MSDFRKTTITLVILSEREVYTDTTDDLADAMRECDEGDFVMHSQTEEVEELSGKAMATALRQAGSTPDFFGLDDNGRPIEED